MSVHNGQPYLAEAVESVLAQDYGDFELLVVDDASTDDSLAVLEQFGGEDPRVRVLRAAKNMGLASALNMALSEARGPLIARMDADDVCRPDRFRLQVTAFDDQPGLELLGSAFFYIDEAGKPIAEGNAPLDDRALQTTLIESGNPFCHPSVMMRTATVRALGGYREVLNRYAQDYDLFLRLAERGTTGNLSDRLIGYRIHSRQMTVKKMRPQLQSALVYRALARQRRNGQLEDVVRAESEARASRDELRDALVSGYLFWAEMLELMGNHTQARQLRWSAIRTAPLDPKVRRLVRSQIGRALLRASQA